MQETLTATRPSDVVDPSVPEPTDATSHAGRRRRLGRNPLFWLVGSYLALLMGWSLLAPTFRGPDEIWHIDLALNVSENVDYPSWDGRILDPAVAEAADYQGAPPYSADEAPARDDRPSFDELRVGAEPEARNHMAQHPPLYYALVGTADRVVDVVVPGDPFGSYDAQIWFFRFVSALMIAPLPLIIHRTGRLLGLSTPVVLAAATFPLAIPQLFHIGSVVNNDNLLILLVSLLVPLAVQLGRGELATRRVLAAGGLTGLALLTKGTAMVVPAWLCLVLLFALWRSRTTWLQTVRSGALYLAVSFVCGGWWWLKNLLVEGKLAPSLEYDRFAEPTGAPTGIARFVHGWAYLTNRRFWGEFGYLEVHLPSVAYVTATVITVVALLTALVWARRRDGRGVDLFDKLVLLAPLAMFAIAVAGQAYRFYAKSGQRPLLQGRYWYPGLVGLALLVAVGLAVLFGRRARYLPPLILGAAAAIQLTAVDVVLGQYWDDAGSGLRGEIAAVRDGVPFPTGVMLVGIVVGAAVLVVMAVAVVRASWTPDEAEDVTAGVV